MFTPHDVRIAAILVAIAALGAAVRVQTHDELEWLAPPREASCAVDALDPTLQRISAKTLAGMLDDPSVSIVDARDPASFDRGHIPGALNLTADTAAEIMQVQSLPIPQENFVVTYCDGGTCAVSEYLGNLLQDEAGCREVHVLEGGFLGWASSDLPIAFGEANR